MKKGVILVFLLSLMLLTLVSAHVSYVATEEEIASTSGPDFSFLLSPFTNWFYVFLMIFTIVVVVALYFFIPKIKFFQKEFLFIKKEASTYDEYIPWIARLGAGIALIGAGSGGVLISPALDTTAFFGTLQIIAGFLLMAGFFTGIAAWGGILLYLTSLFSNFSMFGNIDFLGLSLLIIAFGEGKPGIDDLFGKPFFLKITKLRKYIPYIASMSIGLGMMFLALWEKILNPHMSELVVTQYGLTNVVPVSAAMWVLSAGIIEFAVGFLLFIRFKPRLISSITFLVLTTTFFFFKEEVYSHITLFAILAIIFIIGNRKTLNNENKIESDLPT